MRAVRLMLLMWCGATLGPIPAAAAERAGYVQLMPCAAQLSVTAVPSDPNAVMVRLREPAGPFTGPITAYGKDRIWIGIVERTVMSERYGIHIASLQLHADGPIEAVSYAPTWAPCTFSAGALPPDGYDHDVPSPVLTLADSQPVPPPACAHPYVPTTVTHAVEPTTPYRAAQQMISGDVSVAVALNERGVPQAARIVASASPLLNDASLATAMRSEYAPAVFRCRPVTGGYIFTIDFG